MTAALIVNQILYSQMSLHTLPSWASYVVSIVRIFVKFYVIMAQHSISQPCLFIKALTHWALSDVGIILQVIALNSFDD